jgi:hypothetical protein
VGSGWTTSKLCDEEDGRLHDTSITVSPVKDAAGRIVGASKVARDISERRHLENERALLLVCEQEARRRAEALSNAKMSCTGHRVARAAHAVELDRRLGAPDPDRDPG